MGDKKDSWDAAKEFQTSKGDKPDSSKDFARAEHQAKNDYQDAGSPFGELSNRDRDSKDDVPSRENDSDGSDNSRVICTHLAKAGLLSRELWRADMEFTKTLSPTMVRGYHFWAVPYVRLMRKHPVAEKLILPIAIARANEVGFIMGLRPKGSVLGKLVRFTCEPACWLIGCCVSAQDWQSLYTSPPPEGQSF